MPIVAYYLMKRRRININKDKKGSPPVHEMRDVFSRVKVTVKSESELPAIANRKDFVRWCTGPLSIEEMVSRCKVVGSSQWYV